MDLKTQNPAVATLPWAAVGEEDDSVIESDPDAVTPGPKPTGGVFTIPLLCAGIAIIACTLLIPAADANRRLAYERQKLELDLQAIQKQVAVNAEFLKKLADDPNLAERLAQRQMKIVREGTRVLELKNGSPDEISPFPLVSVAPPPAMQEYRPVGGLVAQLCYRPRPRLYLNGAALLLLAAALVLGCTNRFGG